MGRPRKYASRVEKNAARAQKRREDGRKLCIRFEVAGIVIRWLRIKSEVDISNDGEFAEYLMDCKEALISKFGHGKTRAQRRREIGKQLVQIWSAATVIRWQRIKSELDISNDGDFAEFLMDWQKNEGDGSSSTCSAGSTPLLEREQYDIKLEPEDDSAATGSPGIKDFNDRGSSCIFGVQVEPLLDEEEATCSKQESRKENFVITTTDYNTFDNSDIPVKKKCSDDVDLQSNKDETMPIGTEDLVLEGECEGKDINIGSRTIFAESGVAELNVKYRHQVTGVNRGNDASSELLPYESDVSDISSSEEEYIPEPKDDDYVPYDSDDEHACSDVECRNSPTPRYKPKCPTRSKDRRKRVCLGEDEEKEKQKKKDKHKKKEKHEKEHSEKLDLNCDKCGKKYAKKDSLYKHVMSHELLEDDTTEPQFLCEFCPKKLKTETARKIHQRFCEGDYPYICGVCGRQFPNNVRLRRHSQIHNDEKHLVCEYCGKAFNNNPSLYIHRKIHIGDKPHCCPLCPRRFLSAGRLKVHSVVHTKERQYICDTCGKGFTQRGNMLIHMRLHSGAKPFPCKLCDKSFRVKCLLSSHMKQHTGERPLVRN